MIYGVLHEKRLESVTIEDWNWSIYMETKKDLCWCIVTYRCKIHDLKIVVRTSHIALLHFNPFHKLNTSAADDIKA